MNFNKRPKDSYFLPTDYQTNEPERKLYDESQSPLFWTSQRIRLSKYYQHSVYRLAFSLAEQRRSRVVWDVGCGPATKLTAFFPEPYKIIGIDSEEAIQYCRDKYPRGTFIVTDFDSPEPE